MSLPPGWTDDELPADPETAPCTRPAAHPLARNRTDPPGGAA